MAIGVTGQTGWSENPYLTVAEYKNAPTAIDYDNLVVGGNSQAQDAELARVILRATSYLNEYLNQDYNAGYVTETQRVRVSTQGYVALHPKNDPVLYLSAFSYGTSPQNMIALQDCSTAWFEDQQVIIPLADMATTWSSQGPLAFGPNFAPRVPLFCQYTYVAGYVNTTCSGTAAATSITVPEPAGILPSQPYRIFDGANTETVTVASNYTIGSTTVPITSALVYTHAAGTAFSNMPTAIKEATILMTTAFLKIRGDNSLTMMITTQPNGNTNSNQKYSGEIALALDMVDKYRRVR